MRCYLFYLTGGSLCPVRTSSIGSSTFFFSALLSPYRFLLYLLFSIYTVYCNIARHKVNARPLRKFGKYVDSCVVLTKTVKIRFKTMIVFYERETYFQARTVSFL